MGDRSRTAAGEENFEALPGPWKGRLHNFIDPVSLLDQKSHHSTPLSS
jgi:hypothetical protein